MNHNLSLEGRLDRVTKNPRVTAALLQGISGPDLDSLLRSESLLPTPDTARMNLIGSLRGSGFTVLGGRQGGTIYRVTEWEKPESKVTSWSSYQLAVRQWFDDLPDVLASDAGEVRYHLSTRPDTDVRHENTWLYLWGYELVGNTSNRAIGKFFRSSSGSFIIKRTFADRPRFSLIDLDASPEELYAAARTLSSISFAPVKIINPRVESLSDLDRLFETHLRREDVKQPIYDLNKLVQNPSEFFSRQSWKTARKMLREVQFTEYIGGILEPTEYQNTIIDRWREIREGSQARPAIRRDYVISGMISTSKISILGFREGHPVSYRVVECLSNNSEFASDLVEKSINSSAYPGGHSGISDASLLTIARRLTARGVKFLNGGESSSVGPKLTQYKHKFQVGESYSITLIPTRLTYREDR